MPHDARRRDRIRGLAILVCLAGLMATTRASLATHYYIPSGSMRPTLQVGDRVLVNKAAYGVRVPLTHRWLLERAGPRPGDVVVFDSPADGELLVKRVVAGPGDRVAVRGGRVWRNGAWQPVQVDSHGVTWETLAGRRHRLSLARGGGPDCGPLTVPPRRYLVLGDNRGDSADGRFFGLVRRRAILGRVSGVFMRDGHPLWRPME